jgi:hypothetical protein
MPQIAQSANIANTPVGRDSSGNVAVGQLTNTNCVFTEAPAAGTGRVLDRVTRVSGQLADYNLVVRLSDNPGQSEDNFVLGLYPYNCGSNHLQEVAGVDLWGFFYESSYFQGAARVIECQLRQFNSAGTQKRPWAVYVTTSNSDFTEHIYQASEFSLRTVNAAYDGSSNWFFISQAGVGTCNDIVWTLLNAKDIRVPIESGGNHNSIEWLGFGGYAPTSGYGFDCYVVDGGAGTFDWNFRRRHDSTTFTDFIKIINGVTPVARQTVGAAATDAATTLALANLLRTALINFGFCQA